jgi:hypothetical protein
MSNGEEELYHNTQETYSPVGSRNRRMHWSGVQSTGAEMRKYFTIVHMSDGQQRDIMIHLRLSTCCNAT